MLFFTCNFIPQNKLLAVYHLKIVFIFDLNLAILNQLLQLVALLRARISENLLDSFPDDTSFSRCGAFRFSPVDLLLL